MKILFAPPRVLAPLLLLAIVVWLTTTTTTVHASGLDDTVTVARISGAATGDCTDYTHAIQLKQDVFLLYLLTEQALSIRLEVAHERWVAFGVAPNERGKMVGSDAIIGLPQQAVSSSSNPGKYHMVGETEDDVYLRDASDQTLQNADVWQQDGSTFLAFTKRLDEGNDQHSITTTGINYFIWAYGLEETLGLHDEDDGCGAFAVDAAATLCVPSTTDTTDTTTTEVVVEEDETATPEDEETPAPVEDTEEEVDDSENDQQQPQEATSANGEQDDPDDEDDDEEEESTDEDETNNNNIFDDTSSSNNLANNSSGSLTCEDYQYDVPIDEQLRLQYVVQQGDRISVRLELATEAWLALGLQPKGRMIGGQAVVGLPDEQAGNNNPGLYSMTSETEDGIVRTAASSLVTSNLVQQGGTTVLTFTQLLSGGDGTLSMVADGTSYTTFIWAYGYDNEWRLHKREGSFQLKLEPCTENNGLQVSSSVNSSESKYSYSKTQAMWIAHGFLGVAAWAVLAPMACSAAWLRSLLPDGWWFKIHFYSNILVLLLTLVTFVLAVLLYQSEGKDHFSGTHETIGLIIFMVVVLQAGAGILRPAAPKTEDPEQNAKEQAADGGAEEAKQRQHETDGEHSNSSLSSEEEQTRNKGSSPAASSDIIGKKKIRVAWEVAHKLIGFILIILGLWQVQSGIALYAEEYDSTDYSPVFWIYLGFALTALVLLTVYMRVKAVQ